MIDIHSKKFMHYITIDEDIAYVELTRDKVAIIDTEDVERIGQYIWYYCMSTGGASSGTAPERVMSRFIMNAPSHLWVDHINHNRLDNRKANLRLATPSQSNANERKPCGSRSSEYKGVSRYKRTGKWRAYIGINGRHLHLGYFDDDTLAARAYNEAATEYFGEFAYLNDIPFDDD